MQVLLKRCFPYHSPPPANPPTLLELINQHNPQIDVIKTRPDVIKKLLSLLNTTNESQKEKVKIIVDLLTKNYLGNQTEDKTIKAIPNVIDNLVTELSDKNSSDESKAVVTKTLVNLATSPQIWKKIINNFKKNNEARTCLDTLAENIEIKESAVQLLYYLAQNDDSIKPTTFIQLLADKNSSDSIKHHACLALSKMVERSTNKPKTIAEIYPVNETLSELLADTGTSNYLKIEAIELISQFTYTRPENNKKTNNQIIILIGAYSTGTVEIKHIINEKLKEIKIPNVIENLLELATNAENTEQAIQQAFSTLYTNYANVIEYLEKLATNDRNTQAMQALYYLYTTHNIEM